MASFFRNTEVGPRRIHPGDPESTRQFGTNQISNTKYTVFTFLPLNLLEQFGRPMNLYFLLIGCLQLIPEITPVDPLTTWAPLIVIFAITAVKELVDDLGRARADREANNRKVVVVRDGREQEVSSASILVGDIVKVHEDEEIPCDLVLLSSADEGGGVFIQTTNLDGESNLKGRTCFPGTKDLRSVDAVSGWHGEVVCPPPDDKIGDFDAQMLPNTGASDEDAKPLTGNNLILQATHLRNTAWCYGLAVYVGNATKFGKNKRTPEPKFTRTDDAINEISVYIFLFQLVLVVILGVLGNNIKEASFRDAWYLWFSPLAKDGPEQVVIIPARFLLLNSTMIPISLKVTLDLCKLYYAKFIEGDVALYDEESNNAARANSTALSEDLGQVEYVLTDKTGTLTQNVMALKHCCVGKTAYGGGDVRARGARGNAPGGKVATMWDPSLRAAIDNEVRAGGGEGSTLELLRCMVLNNDVRPEARDAGEDGSADGGGRSASDVRRAGGSSAGDVPPPSPADHLVYKASSPDEEAFVRGARPYGVALLSREGGVNEQRVQILDNGTPETYQQLVVFPFDSDRKRMSVLVRTPAGQVRLYTKGADDKLFSDEVGMLSRAPGANPEAGEIQEWVNRWAAEGLRTLVFAYKNISDAEYDRWRAMYDAAAKKMSGRKEAEEAAFVAMEKDLILLGATAVEDKLQTRVPEVIARLRRANVRFWMCTGDKQSTAETIARTCRLLAVGSDGTLQRPLELAGDNEEEIKTSLDKLMTKLERDGYKLRGLPAPSRLPRFIGAAWCGSRGVAAESTSTNDVVRQAALSGPDGDEPVASGDGDNGEGAGGAAGGGGDVESGGGGEEAPKGGELTRGTEVSSPLDADAPPPFTIIVKGDSIRHALEFARDDFAKVALAARSVICCRVTPKQKAQLVRLVRDAGHLALAIGDGGNDVAMIQEAQVGVGIRGKEGLQAARAADYQVGMFQALERLLLIHGHYSYYRTALVAQYSFYKSFLFCFIQISYAIFSGASGVSLFNSLTVAAYNAVLFVPIVFFFLDKDVDQETALRKPEFYRPGQSNELFNYVTMLRDWWFRALFHAAAMVVILFPVASTMPLGGSYESLGLVMFMGYFFVQDFTMLTELRRPTWANIGSIFGMHLLAIAVGLFCNSSLNFLSFIDYQSFNNALEDPNLWFTNFLMLLVTVGPILIIKVICDDYFPTVHTVIREYDNRYSHTEPLCDSCSSQYVTFQLGTSPSSSQSQTPTTAPAAAPSSPTTSRARIPPSSLPRPAQET